MKLVELVLQILYLNVYTVEAYPIFSACSAEGASVGEQLLTLLGHGFADSGRGLGVHPSGINTASADMLDLSAAESTRIWRACARFRKEQDVLPGNVRYDLRNLARINAAQQGQEEELRRVEAELKKSKGKEKELRNWLQNLADSINKAEELLKNEGPAKALAEKLLEGLRSDMETIRASL